MTHKVELPAETTISISGVWVNGTPNPDGTISFQVLVRHGQQWFRACSVKNFVEAPTCIFVRADKILESDVVPDSEL